MNLRFSVLITAYNYRDYVEQALDSALGQQHPPEEILVVDDGSTDGTTELLRDCCRKDPRIRLIEQDNAGQLAAFSAGIRAARGSYIALLDADDWWAPDYLSRCARLLSEVPQIDVLNSNLSLAGERQGLYLPSRLDRRIGLSALRVHARHALLGSPTSAVCLSRDLAMRIVSLPEDMQRDWVTEADTLLHLAAGLLGANQYMLGSNVSAHYRIHGGNQFAGRGRDAVFHMRRHLRIARAVTFYAAAAGICPLLYRHAAQEFATIEKPRMRELFIYCWLQWRASEPWTRCGKGTLSMLARYLRDR